MADELEKGDHVTWNSHGGRTAVHRPGVLHEA
jgi:hypothetical protein